MHKYGAEGGFRARVAQVRSLLKRKHSLRGVRRHALTAEEARGKCAHAHRMLVYLGRLMVAPPCNLHVLRDDERLFRERAPQGRVEEPEVALVTDLLPVLAHEGLVPQRLAGGGVRFSPVSRLSLTRNSTQARRLAAGSMAAVSAAAAAVEEEAEGGGHLARRRRRVSLLCATCLCAPTF